jgi:hypothetical protein
LVGFWARAARIAIRGILLWVGRGKRARTAFGNEGWG